MLSLSTIKVLATSYVSSDTTDLLKVHIKDTVSYARNQKFNVFF